MMLGRPGCDENGDLEAFRRIFTVSDSQPNLPKLYPCLVPPGKQVHGEWMRGEYKHYSTEESARLIVELKQYVPRWVRIMRIQREIPVDGISDGVKHGNLRQLVQKELKRRGMKCQCIRCREAGISYIRNGETPDMEQIQLKRIDYEGSGGTDVFISFEDPEHDILVGYVRLRIPTVNAHRPEVARHNSAIIRELHVFGQTVPVGDRLAGAFQHNGYGSKLLCEAEKSSRQEYDRQEIVRDS